MIEVEQHGEVAVIAFANGKVNAIDVALLRDLQASLQSLADEPSVGSVILTGTGRTFSAGLDLRQLVEGGKDYVSTLLAELGGALTLVFSYPKPTVAAINGAAVAGGCIVAAACDARLMAQDARIGATELSVGVTFPVEALEILRHTCGRHTESVVFGARLLDPHEAIALGLVDEIVAPEELTERAMLRANQLGSLPAEAYRLTKEQLRRPALERMRSSAEGGSAATTFWQSPETIDRVRAQLERLSARG